MNTLKSLSHEQAAELLPWLVNGSLDSEEKENLLQHTLDCVMCRRELDELKRLSNSIADAAESMFIPAPDMRGINARIDGLINRQDRRREWMSGFREMILNPWRLAFVAQIILIVVLASGLVWRGSEEPEFSTLTQPRNLPDGHYFRVVFSPDLTASELSNLLDEMGLTVANGPSDRGVFTLGTSRTMTEDERARLLEKLQEEPNLLFAQPAVSGDN